MTVQLFVAGFKIDPECAYAMNLRCVLLHLTRGLQPIRRTCSHTTTHSPLETSTVITFLEFHFRQYARIRLLATMFLILITHVLFSPSWPRLFSPVLSVDPLPRNAHPQQVGEVAASRRPTRSTSHSHSHVIDLCGRVHSRACTR